MEPSPLVYDTAAAAAVWQRVGPALPAYDAAPCPAGACCPLPRRETDSEAMLGGLIAEGAALYACCRRCAVRAPRQSRQALEQLAREEQRAVRALLEIARGADLTENLTTLAKTGLCALSEEQVCALENYAYTWAPTAAAWREKFERSPKGFGEQELTEEDLRNRERAEHARALLVGAVDAFRAKVRGVNAEAISRAVYFCLKTLGAEEQQAAQVKAIRAGRGIPAAEEAAREWNVVMGLLNEMAHLLGEQTVTVAEYEDLFGLLLRSSDLGHIPQTLDAVVLASAGKMRLDAPEFQAEAERAVLLWERLP